eukprot:1394176-Amorphochlora_amoeboformis.AAC.1
MFSPKDLEKRSEEADIREGGDGRLGRVRATGASRQNREGRDGDPFICNGRETAKWSRGGYGWI